MHSQIGINTARPLICRRNGSALYGELLFANSLFKRHETGDREFLAQPFWRPSVDGPADEAPGLFWVGTRICLHDAPRGSMEDHSVDGVHDTVNTAITQVIDFSLWVVEA